MSVRGRVALAVGAALMAYTVWYVHDEQKQTQKGMKKNLARDYYRQQEMLAKIQSEQTEAHKDDPANRSS